MSWRFLWASVVLFVAMTVASSGAEAKRVLLLGQKRDHPAGTHEYMAGVKLLAHTLANVPGLELHVAQADEPCPEVPALIDRADALVLYLGEGAKWIQQDPERLRAVEALAARKGGLVTLHWGIGAKDGRYIDRWLELAGGCHGGPDRKYIFCETDLRVLAADHPTTRGVADFRMDDEFYYRLKFARKGTVVPLLAALIEGQPETVAWAYTRPEGGRSFGFSAMHAHGNWGLEPCRRLVGQGILWTLDLPVPAAGLEVPVAAADLQLDK